MIGLGRRFDQSKLVNAATGAVDGGGEVGGGGTGEGGDVAGGSGGGEAGGGETGSGLTGGTDGEPGPRMMIALMGEAVQGTSVPTG